MKNSRNQLIIAIVFALLLGLIIVAASRCGASKTPAPGVPAATKTALARSTVLKTPGLGTVVPGKATDVAIVPPGGSPMPTSTPVSVGPLPPGTPPPAATAVTSQSGVATPVTSQPNIVVVPTKAPTPKTQATAAAINVIVHVVKAGESLGGIAQQYKTTISDIVAANNNLSSGSVIQVGQKVNIPVPAGYAGTNTPTTSSKVYVVQPGDTLGGIAKRFNTTVKAISDLNKITNPNLIRPGQKLTLP
jgi:LysM repeat protein